ncbi:MATE family efflux transporter [Chondromyces apiculatus]|uniref:Multidrug-efflux transporter n=1 Tax=Chondromyces apiculatus DSM 436 TaxID=1192034 RepID=A0A017T8T4_9BACT|nr:MATE family efflux transporter [Chondromyces apiculatus]EYF05377.1 Multi antimicrobial extrusion protein (Na(+)/drug antiporter) [Chondromyces apiculatus DSM 436]
MSSKSGTDLTVGSIPKHIITFSLPMIAGGLLHTAYSFINAIWVGQYLGRQALAAITVSFPVVFTVIGIAIGMTLAANILVSQRYGAKRFDELRRIVDATMVLSYGLGIVLMILGEVFAPFVLRAMDTPPDVFHESVGYLRIYMVSLPLTFGTFALRSMLQGMGDSRTPLLFQFGSVVLMTILDPLLIFGHLGLPRLGLNGTAWATNIAQLVVVIALHVHLRLRGSPIAPRWPRFEGLGAEVKTVLRIGIPASVQQSLGSLGMVMVTGIVNGFGEVSTAAFGAASRIDQIAFLPAINFGMAISTLAGQNLGAGHLDRVREVFRWGCLFSGTISLVISFVAAVFPEVLLRVFIGDPEVIQHGVAYLHIVGSCYVFFSLMFVSNGIINGSGSTVVTTLISLISLWVFRVPVAYWLSRAMNSELGVWYAISLSFLVSMVVSMGYYFSGRWKQALGKKKGPSSSPTDAKPVPDPGEVFVNEVGEV